MNVDSFKDLDLEEKEIFKKIYSNLYEGDPLTGEEFKVLKKGYNEISNRMEVYKQEVLNKRKLRKMSYEYSAIWFNHLKRSTNYGDINR